MLTTKLTTYRSFTPAASCSPQVVLPEQLLHRYPISAGAVRGERYGPSVIVPALCIS